MGDIITVLPPELREEFRIEKLEENYTILKILPFVVMVSSALYLLQYYFFPGVESLSQFKTNYIFLFLFAFIVSLVFRLLLPITMKIKSFEIKENLNMLYLGMIFIFCVNLTAFDLQISTDFSAYAVGLLSLAFLLRTTWWKYLKLAAVGFIVFSIIYYQIGKHILPVNETLPIFVFTLLSVYIKYSREQTKVQLFLLKHELKESAVKDPLTSLYNRRYMLEFLTKQFAFFARYKTEISILILDIDFFKSINDKLGHGVGDSVLEDFAGIILNEIRDTDIACRYGGEEFVLILSDTGKENAHLIAERIRTKIEKNNFGPVSWTITASIGVSVIEDGDDQQSIMERADSNLYKAKNSGRNKVV